MIVVSGTKRSGTSMWMQALEAGGFLVLGTRFMKNWEATIKDANPHGFYESVLRRGIYFATNPHPETGIYLPPKDTRRVAVKVFPPGLARTDMAFLDHVIVTMRPWREYVTSLQRLYAMEDAARARRQEERAPGSEPKPRPPRVSPHIEWWLDNYVLVRDIATRQYPARITTYPRMLREPEQVLSEVFRFLGGGDVHAAMATIKPETRTQEGSDVDVDLEEAHAEVFDALFATVDEGRPLTPELIQRMNEVHAALMPTIQREVSARRATRRRRPRRDATLAASIAVHAAGIPATEPGGDEGAS